MLVDASPGCLNYSVLCPAFCQNASISAFPYQIRFSAVCNLTGSRVFFTLLRVYILISTYPFWIFICSFTFFFFKSQGLVYLGWFWICFVAKDNHELLSLPPPPDCRDCRYVLYLISFSAVTQTQGLGMPGKHCANCQPQPLLLFILGAGLTMEPRLALNSQFYPTSWVLGLQPGLHPHSQPLEFIPNPSWPSGHRWFPALVFTNRRPFSIPKLPSRLCPKDP